MQTLILMEPAHPGIKREVRWQQHYEEETAREIADAILDKYYYLFDTFLRKMEALREE